MRDLFFYLGTACLFTHELDAMPNHEWRVLPLLDALPDELGMFAFVAGHVPLFAFALACIASSVPRTRTVSRLVVSGFLVVHGLAHGLSIGRANYEFASTLSNVLILGAAAFGALFLFLEWKKCPTEAQ